MIVADNAAFTDYLQIGTPLKRGTAIIPSTDLEEGAELEGLSAAKKLQMDVTSANQDEELSDFLSAAEDSRTPLYFRFFLLNPLYYFDVLALHIYAQRELTEAGKFNALRISGAKTGAAEADLFNLVYMFNPFNPENL